MTSTADELERLAQLRRDGVLTEAEFEAQKAAVLKGASPAVDSKNSKVGCAVLIVLAIVLVLFFGPSSPETTTEQPAASTQPPMEVTAAQLNEAYDANEASAQEIYGGRPLLVSGEVSGIDLDFSNDPVVKLKTANQFQSAQAQLADSAKASASSLSKGQKVTLRCESVTEVVGSPILRECTLP